MSQTPNLHLSYLASGQAQKHVMVNSALDVLDAVVQLGVGSASFSDPPASPEEGDRYIVADAPTAEWVGQVGRIAHWRAGEWVFYAPRSGWRAYTEDTGKTLIFDGVVWVDQAAMLLNPAMRVGVNTVADDTNRFAVKSDAVLFSHDDVTPGSGDIRLSLNRSDDTGVASLIYKTGWSGRAEIGLVGDGLSARVSGDGQAWRDAIVVDGQNGQVYMPNTPNDDNLMINGDFEIWQRGAMRPISSTGYVRTADRFYGRALNTEGAGQASRTVIDPQDVGAPPGAVHGYLHEQTVGANVSPLIGQAVEGVRRLAGRRLTLSFYARASQVLNVRAYFVQMFGAGGSANNPFYNQLAFSVSTEWALQSLSFDVPDVAGKTVGVGDGVRFELLLPTSTVFSIEVARMKLQLGDFATPLRAAPLQLTLEQCRRYFRRYASQQNISDLAYVMQSAPVESGAGPYDYDAELV